MTGHVISGLARRRREVAGELQAARERVAALMDDLAALDAVLRQFAPGFDFAALRPVRARPGAAGRGATCRAVLTLLRTAPAPMTAAQVADRLAADCGEADAGDKAARERARDKVAQSLRRLRKDGAVRSAPGTGPRGAVVWEVAR